jgi:hypothetical protein
VNAFEALERAAQVRWGSNVKRLRYQRLIMAIAWARSHMLTRASLIRHVEDDIGGLAGLEHEIALSRAGETGKIHVQQETRGLQSCLETFEKYHANAVQKIVVSCSYVPYIPPSSFSEEGERALFMAVLERHDPFGIVSCRKLKWLLVSHTDCQILQKEKPTYISV